jgi:hypothetical protein
MKVHLLSRKQGNEWGSRGDLAFAPDLVFYFGARADLATPACYDELAALFPGAHVVGCSTGGQIHNDEVTDAEVAAAALAFDRTSLRVVHEEIADAAASFATGAAIGARLNATDLAGIFILSDGLHVNGSGLVAGITSAVGGNVPLTGGLAGDGANFAATLVGADFAPRTNVVAAIGFYGSAIRIGYGSAGGWDQFGPRRRITRSDGNVLYELDGEPALDLYERYLGEEAEGLPSTALLFPLRIYEPSRPDHDLVRTVLAVDREARSMTFAGDVPEGWVAQLMRGNFGRLAAGAAAAARAAHLPAEEEKLFGDEIALLVSCIGRRLLMGQSTADEVEAAAAELGAHAKLIGFYSYGEISPNRGSGVCQLHNQTMTITTLHEAA